MSIDCTNARLGSIAAVQSGVYMKNEPLGDVVCLQLSDLLSDAPEKIAMKVARTKRIDNYLLQKGDLLFAGKGTTYYCGVFDLDVPAVASTTLYSIRLQTDAVSPAYLCWYLNHPNVVAAIKKEQAGSGTPLIRKPTLENLQIVVPAPRLQSKIVELSILQKREAYLHKAIAEKRTMIINYLLFNKIK